MLVSITFSLNYFITIFYLRWLSTPLDRIGRQPQAFVDKIPNHLSRRHNWAPTNDCKFGEDTQYKVSTKI